MSDDVRPIVVTNPWTKLRQFTPARIALGRTGVSQPTSAHLAFQVAHARARNAVHHALDCARLEEALSARGHEVVRLHSAAPDRPTYLQRPDLGRRLDDKSRQWLEARGKGRHDIAFVIADGLSAFAIEQNVVPFLDVLLPRVAEAKLDMAPLVIVEQGRVAVGDEIGSLMGAALVVMLIGERPGLSSPDSLGIYLTYNPKTGATDADRNCISNIRAEGLSYDEGAHKLLYLVTEARKRQMSGVMLKDEAETLAKFEGTTSRNFLIDG